MKLVNFHIAKPGVVIDIKGLGHNWNLHQQVQFSGLKFSPAEDEVYMEWSAPDGAENPWEDKTNHFSKCRLVFRGIKSVFISPRDPEYPLGESQCVDSMYVLDPEAIDFPASYDPLEGSVTYKEEWTNEDEDFSLAFIFTDYKLIAIDSEFVILEAE